MLFPTPEHVESFCRSLDTQALGRCVHFHESAGSTNDLAKEAALAGVAHGTVFIAEKQERGRGQHGRVWHSPPGRGLLFSVVIRPGDLVRDQSWGGIPAGWLALVAGIAAADGMAAAALAEGFLLPANIKWPNDIVVPSPDDPPGWRKLGGVLCESVVGSGGSDFVIIGIGLNIDHRAEDFPVLTKAPPTSLRLETGHEFDRVTVLRHVLQHLEHCCLALASGMGSVEQRMNAALKAWLSGRLMTVSVPGTTTETISGRYYGLDSDGRLMIRDGNGARHSLTSADILSVS